MFIPISLMLVGIALGLCLRKVAWLAQVPRAITPTILLLLFVLGVAVGGDPVLMGNLPLLGGRALALTLAGVGGSMLAVLFVRRFFPGAQAGRHAHAAMSGERAGSAADASGMATAFEDAPVPPEASGRSAEEVHPHGR